MEPEGRPRRRGRAVTAAAQPVFDFDAAVRLPTGVRLKKDEARGRHVLLGPERALVMDPIGIAILGEVDGVKSVSADDRRAGAGLLRRSGGDRRGRCRLPR